MLEALLARRQVPFRGRTLETSDESGIYMFSDRRTNEALYVGQTKTGFKSRFRDHWDGFTSSDLSKRLMVDGVVESVPQGRNWIRDNVVIRWITDNELDMCLKWAEHFAIGVLRPKFNK
jgi:hypothetical protein